MLARFTETYFHCVGNVEIEIPVGALCESLPVDGDLALRLRLDDHYDVLEAWENEIWILNEDTVDPGFTYPALAQRCTVNEQRTRCMGAVSTLRRRGWTVHDIYDALTTSRRAIDASWAPDGDADDVVSAILADTE